MVDHPPSTIDASEPVRCGKRKGVATNQFDANHLADLIRQGARSQKTRFEEEGTTKSSLLLSVLQNAPPSDRRSNATEKRFPAP